MCRRGGHEVRPPRRPGAEPGLRDLRAAHSRPRPDRRRAPANRTGLASRDPRDSGSLGNRRPGGVDDKQREDGEGDCRSEPPGIGACGRAKTFGVSPYQSQFSGRHSRRILGGRSGGAQRRKETGVGVKLGRKAVSACFPRDRRRRGRSVCSPVTIAAQHRQRARMPKHRADGEAALVKMCLVVMNPWIMASSVTTSAEDVQHLPCQRAIAVNSKVLENVAETLAPAR